MIYTFSQADKASLCNYSFLMLRLQHSNRVSVAVIPLLEENLWGEGEREVWNVFLVLVKTAWKCSPGSSAQV